MLVKDCMTRHPIMIPPTMPAAEAQKIMAENKIRHLPVISDGKRLLGLITRQRLALKPDMLGSLNVWEITRHLSNLTVKKVMLPAKEVHTIVPDKTVERAARTMTDHKIGCLPVIDDEVVVGIITEADLLLSFQEMLGLHTEGVRVTVRQPDQVGEGIKLIKAVSEQGWPIMGMAGCPAPRRPGYYDVVLKIAGVSLSQVQEVVSRVSEQEIVDIRTVV
ncbi:MAG: CBS domain-containing protein [Anaerolineae bacterium]